MIRKAGFGGPEPEAIIRKIPVEALQDNLKSFVQSVSEAFKHLPRVGDFALKEVELNIEVTASGGIALIGTASVEAKGAISLRFGG